MTFPKSQVTRICISVKSENLLDFRKINQVVPRRELFKKSSLFMLDSRFKI